MSPKHANNCESGLPARYQHVIYILRGRSPAARARLRSLAPDEIAAVSVITEAELLYGLAKSGASDHSREALNWFLARLQVLPWGRDEAAAYGWLRDTQEAMGKPLGPLDMQIAAQAIARGAIVVTNDKAFSQVQELSGVVSWAVDA